MGVSLYFTEVVGIWLVEFSEKLVDKSSSLLET